MQSSLQTSLKRSANDKVLAGVCGGLARYFEVDSTLVRLVFIALLFAGIGWLAYPILWIVMPREDGIQIAGAYVQPGPGARFDPMTGEPLQQPVEGEQPVTIQNYPARRPQNRQHLLGMGLLLLGAFIMADYIFPWAMAMLVPLLLIGAGLMLLGRTRSGTPRS
jgi:phage shock protein C